MTLSQIVKAKDFEQVSEVRPDEKRRVMLKRVKRSSQMYRIYENSMGQIILDPVMTIPASELWLFENKAALASVQAGVKDAAAGRVVKKSRRGRAA